MEDRYTIKKIKIGIKLCKICNTECKEYTKDALCKVCNSNSFKYDIVEKECKVKDITT